MPNTDPVSDPQAEIRHTRVLTILAAIASASALWAVFLWRELLAARAGETPFCGFGESADCGDLWSAAFASTLHGMTGVPVAGWGLVWALVAAMLPLAALVYQDRKTLSDTTSTAIEVTAIAGVVGIVVLLAASAAEGLFCTSCALTYVLTLAYAAVTFFALHRPKPRASRGLIMAAAATVAAYLLLLYPGLQTPRGQSVEGQQALANAPRAEPIATSDSSTPSTTTTDATTDGGTSSSDGPRMIGGVDVDRMLEEFIATLEPPVMQGLADTLLIYRRGKKFPTVPPRVLARGEAGARVQITEFTDILCPHCATLHQSLAQLERILPKGSFNVDSRQFPLDGRCNAHLRPGNGDNVRCLAAKAQICLEGSDNGKKFSANLFVRQSGLTSDQVYEIAAPYIERDALVACLRSESTERKLSDDVEFAWLYEPHGTPLVLVDGREGHSYAPFLYAIILAGGDPDHPAFAGLPPGNPPPPHQH